jgi:RNA polymerase sigma-70 factor (ECF subfamily)
VVDAFLAALRGGDFEGLLAVLDPNLVVQADFAAAAGGSREIRGAQVWARGALAFSQQARFARTALVNGTVGVVMAPRGRLFRVLRLTITGGRIARIDVVTDPTTLDQLDLAVCEG